MNTKSKRFGAEDARDDDTCAACLAPLQQPCTTITGHQVDRLFDLKHASKLDQLEAAAAVLGRHIEVRVAG